MAYTVEHFDDGDVGLWNNEDQRIGVRTMRHRGCNGLIGERIKIIYKPTGTIKADIAERKLYCTACLEKIEYESQMVSDYKEKKP